MIKKYENKSLLLNVDLANKKAGSVIQIPVDKEGTPMDRYWRDRIKDARMDGCVSFVSEKSEETSEKEVVDKTTEKPAAKQKKSSKKASKS